MTAILFSFAAFLALLAVIGLVFGPAEVALLTFAVLSAWSAMFVALALTVNFLVDKFFGWRPSAATSVRAAPRGDRPDDDDDHVDAPESSSSTSLLPSLPEPFTQTEVWWFQQR